MKELKTVEVRVKVQLPRDVAEVVEGNEELQQLLVKLGARELKRRLELLALADKLVPESKITEEEIMEVDEKVKEALWRRYRQDGSRGRY